MSPHRKVRPIPEREDLPAEIAAIGIPSEDDEEEITIVLNANDDDLATTYREFHPGIIIPVLLAWMLERPVRMVADHQIGTAVTATALASSVVVTGAQPLPQAPEMPMMLPNPTSYIVPVPPPSASVTRRRDTQPPTRDVSPPTTERPARLPDEPRGRPEEERTKPPKSSTPQPTQPQPSKTVDRVINESPDDPERPAETAAPSPERDPSTGRPATDPPAPPAQDAPAPAEKDCLVQVDVDPILDVGVLC